MNRQERRQLKKEKKYNGSIGFNNNKVAIPTGYIDHPTGKKFKTVDEYLDFMERELAQRASDIASKMLWDTEVYIGVANIIAMLYAVKMTVGDLKTVQKNYQKIIDNFNSAMDYVDKIGIRKAYEEFASDYGIQLEFDDCDMNWIDDNEEEIRKRFGLRIGEK